MILYTLTNASFQMDVYEDKVVFSPRWWKSATSKQWETAIVLPYAKVQRVELNKKLWPQGHQLIFRTDEKAITFSFRRLYPFFERLQVYLERQVIRYYNRPQGFPVPMKTVLDIVEERKKTKATPRRETGIAA